MNSSQRRKTKREHPYGITLTITGVERYYVFDDRVTAAKEWCKKKCTGSYVIDNNGYRHAEFRFANEKDAIIFGLKVL
jgi:hypothetical protein